MAEAATAQATEAGAMFPPRRSLIIWRGSQFCIKVMAAFATKNLWQGVDYTLVSTPVGFNERKKLLPAPHTLPVLLWDGEVISGSDHICAFLDKMFPDPQLLYPTQIPGGVDIAQIEKQCSQLYWINGWLSTIDPAGFERYCGAFLRTEARKQSRLAKGLIFIAPKRATALIAKLIFVGGLKEVLVRRGGQVGGRLAATKPKHAPTVKAEAREALVQLEALLQTSTTLWFGNSASPTAADLTLYGMLERWVGDMWMPNRHGPSQPDLIDGLPALRGAFDECRRLFMPRCSLEVLDEATYLDITEPVGDHSAAAGDATEADGGGAGACTWDRAK